MRDDTENVLNTVERNYCNFVEASITHHEYLMKMPEESKNIQQYAHHKVMLETYQAILANLNRSNKFGTV